MALPHSLDYLPHAERVQAILNFWFGDPSDAHGEYGQQRKVWFKKDSGFDASIRQTFLSDYDNAKTGRLDEWSSHPRSCLALVLLLDQVPRNIFRGSAQSFATDSKALSIARHGLEQQWDRHLIPVERIFLYLPFEHSEHESDQDISLELFQNLVDHNPELQTTLDYAHQHRDIIQRFGRFPHRNEILSRETTQAEADFLRQPGSRF
jgi:uncharacterized protein (DUF924 family)